MSEAPKPNKYTTSFERPPTYCGQVLHTTLSLFIVSEAPVEAPKPKKYESYNAATYKTDEEKKEELMSAISGKLEQHAEPLPQDLTEGVDEDEWVRTLLH